jgi:hypothetical protein
MVFKPVDGSRKMCKLDDKNSCQKSIESVKFPDGSKSPLLIHQAVSKNGQ